MRSKSGRSNMNHHHTATPSDSNCHAQSSLSWPPYNVRSIDERRHHPTSVRMTAMAVAEVWEDIRSAAAVSSSSRLWVSGRMRLADVVIAWLCSQCLVEQTSEQLAVGLHAAPPPLFDKLPFHTPQPLTGQRVSRCSAMPTVCRHTVELLLCTAGSTRTSYVQAVSESSMHGSMPIRC